MTDDQIEEETSALAARMFANLWLYVHAKEHAAKAAAGEASDFKSLHDLGRSMPPSVKGSASMGDGGLPMLARKSGPAPGSSDTTTSATTWSASVGISGPLGGGGVIAGQGVDGISDTLPQVAEAAAVVDGPAITYAEFMRALHKACKSSLALFSSSLADDAHEAWSSESLPSS
jgi:hypothetical protein